MLPVIMTVTRSFKPSRYVPVPNYINTRPDGRLYLANISLFGVPSNYSTSTFSTPPVLSNVECALWVCVQTYKTIVESSIQHQSVVSTHDQFEQDTGDELGFSMTLPAPDRNASSQGRTTFAIGAWEPGLLYNTLTVS